MKKYKNLVVIGLVGGIASGKSTAAKILSEFGAELIDADELTHEELENPKTRDGIVSRFGKGILDTQGGIDRKKLSLEAFSSEEKLQALTELIHPRVIKRVHDKLSGFNKMEKPVAVVIEAALLVEAGLDEICDYIVFVQCSLKTRLWRAKQNRQWKEGELKRRENFQLVVNEKKAVSTHVVNNNLSPGYMKESLVRFWMENIKPEIDKIENG